MTKDRINEYIERRANAMAMVLLSGRDDLRVTGGEKGSGIDLIVSVVKHDHSTFRQFGVILQGHAQAFELAREAGPIMDSLLSEETKIEEVLTPICVFLFQMTGLRGYYAWKFEPKIGKSGPRLRERKTLESHILNESTLANIVKSVDRYYDALAVTLIKP